MQKNSTYKWGMFYLGLKGAWREVLTNLLHEETKRWNHQIFSTVNIATPAILSCVLGNVIGNMCDTENGTHNVIFCVDVASLILCS